jgi:cytochrome P450
MQSTLFFLALNPTWQQRVYNEMLAVLENGADDETVDWIVTHEHFARLKCLDWCWKESMRLHSPIPIVGRQLVEEILLGKNEEY